jgi:autoinducer 2-degrading protein
MTSVVIQIVVMGEHLDSFVKLTRENIAHRRSADGNLKFEVYQQEDNPTHFVMVEVFKFQQSIDAYYATPGYLEWHKAVTPMMVSITGADYLYIEQRD